MLSSAVSSASNFCCRYSTRSFKWVLSWQFFFTFFNSKYLGFFWLNTHLSFSSPWWCRCWLLPSPWSYHRRTGHAFLINTSMRMYHALGLGKIQRVVANEASFMTFMARFLWCHQASIWMFACYWLNWARHRVLCDVCNGCARWNGANRSIIDGAMKNGPSLIFC